MLCAGYTPLLMGSRPGDATGSKDGNDVNDKGFAFIKTDGYVAWDGTATAGQVAPLDGGYTNIYTNEKSWVAVKPNGEIFCWGQTGYGVDGCPVLGCDKVSCTNAGVDSYYPKPIKYVYSLGKGFCALYVDTTVYCWVTGVVGDKSPPSAGWVTASAGSNKAPIHYSTTFLNKDGSLWSEFTGTSSYGLMPTTGKYISLHNTYQNVIALSDTGAIASWGSYPYTSGSVLEPSGYVSIRAGYYGYCALWIGTKYDISETGMSRAYNVHGRIDCRSHVSYKNYVGEGAASTTLSPRPTDDGYVSLHSNYFAYVGLKADGTAKPFGVVAKGGKIPVSISPNNELQNVTRIVSNYDAFVAVKNDGSLVCWGTESHGGAHATTGATTCPPGTDYTDVSASYYGFAAINSVGAIVTWGMISKAGSTNVLRTTADTDYARLYMLDSKFAAQKDDGTIRTFGANAAETTDDSFCSSTSCEETGWILCATKGMYSAHNEGLEEGSECGGYGDPYANVLDAMHTACDTVPNSNGKGHIEIDDCKPAAGYAQGTYAQAGAGLPGYSGSFEGQGA